MINDMLRRFAKHARLVAVIAAFLIAIGAGVCWQIRDSQIDDNPAKVYARYDAQLAAYMNRLAAGGVAANSQGDYAIPKFLTDRGARYVRRVGTCFVITFGFMPTDAVPELWYSPTGFDPPPSGMDERKRQAYFRFTQLAPCWGECYWDS